MHGVRLELFVWKREENGKDEEILEEVNIMISVTPIPTIFPLLLLLHQRSAIVLPLRENARKDHPDRRELSVDLSMTSPMESIAER